MLWQGQCLRWQLFFFFFIESLLSDARNPVARQQQNIALIKLSWKPMKHADDMLLHLNPAPNWVSQPRLTWVCLLPCEHSVGHSRRYTVFVLFCSEKKNAFL